MFVQKPSSRIRLSLTACSNSPRAFPSQTAVLVNRTIPITKGRSRPRTADTINVPSPWRPSTDSTITEPPSTLPSDRPAIVRTGLSAGLIAWRNQRCRQGQRCQPEQNRRRAVHGGRSQSDGYRERDEREDDPRRRGCHKDQQVDESSNRVGSSG